VKLDLSLPETRLLALLAPAALSVHLFWGEYASVIELLLRPELLQMEGSYPLVMLLFLLLFACLRRRELWELMKSSGAALKQPALAAVALILSSLAAKFLADFHTVFAVQALALYFAGFFVLLFPGISGLALPALALFVPLSALPMLVGLYLDQPVSLAFVEISKPVLSLLGYHVAQDGQLLLLALPSGAALSLNINSACAGVASQSVFLFLSGLMYLDLRPSGGRALALVLAGSASLVFINVMRLAAIAFAGFLFAHWALLQAHAVFGYVAFTAFYGVYAHLFIRAAGEGRAARELKEVES